VLVVQAHPVGQDSAMPVNEISHADQCPALPSGTDPTLCNVLAKLPYIM